MTVRVRYAPSPTGEPHIGNIRTVVFNSLFARHTGGKLVLRIEDTDQQRYTPGSARVTIEALNWLGIEFDEGPSRDELRAIGEDWDGAPEIGGPHGPYIQSLRSQLYQQYAQELLARGWAYRCDCSPERLAAVRQQQTANKQSPGYDRLCRAKKPGEVSPDEPHVVRLAVPLEGCTSFHDQIKGKLTVENAQLDDQVLVKSDGLPTYHLAVVVDDHTMGITHVIRADEWLPSTPKHVLLYQALGWDLPVFAHVPMVLGEDGRKLSKRHGATSISEFRKQGFLPEALFNFLVFLGWSPGEGEEREFFSRQELVERFSLDHVNRAGAVFSYPKLDWINGEYIRALAHDELARRLLPYLAAGLGLPEEEIGLDKVRQLVPLVRERLKRLTDVVEWCDVFFVDFPPPEADRLIGKKMEAATSLAALRRAIAVLEGLPDSEWGEATLEELLRKLVDELGLKTGQLFGIVRVAVTGKDVAPPLFGTLAVLGQAKSLERLRAAEAQLASKPLGSVNK
ncbi:MAG: glutamate--tRNA ligase [Thermoflexales bacterium]|nr:glutamate--tRNA ligase [Thermoflexales bacterium]